MHAGEIKNQSILRCGLCNKPFDKPSTLKRHGYYCRSRRTGNTVRSRSCIPCAKAKARCDNQRPECSRCVGRAGECRYPTTAGVSAKSTPSSQESDPSFSIPSNAQSEGRELAHDSLVVADVTANLGLGFEVGGEYLPWDDLDIDFADFLNQPLNMNLSSSTGNKDVQYPSPGSSIPAESPASAVQQPSKQTPTPLTSIPPPMPSLPRLLIPRPNSKAGTQRTTTLIQHTLKSYLMLLRRTMLPPFIHPLSLTAHHTNSVNPNYANPLAKCLSWIRTTSSECTGRAVFWGNVRSECERLCVEYSGLDKWDLLSAMQASAFYILVRIDEGETEHNNLDFLLLATVTVLAKQLTWDGYGALVPQTPLLSESQIELDEAWKDWVIEESRRRLAIVYRVINMLVYFEPAARCDLPKDLVLAPLPAKKQLWEAPDRLAWKQEVDREPGVRTAFGLAVTGELVRFEVERDGEGADVDVHAGDRDRARDGGRSVEERRGRGEVLAIHEDLLLHKATNTSGKSLLRSEASWEEWCEGMDGLGGLIMLVASLFA
ncbi:hypothetical protein BJY01DRAFT_128821 [Aspergillus pseudoustus]|uniref:Zn(2)-C6 fungal-type domain-containing protein n=1 Tax=Aspergillus pseudoustus TaxID=1810923 RepID=A0ABR4IPP3_9EURO